MIKFIISLLLTALLAFAFGLYFSWWSISIAAFLVPILIYQRPLRSFFSGFTGLFLLWLILIVTIDSSNEGILAPKISMVMGFGESKMMLMLVTCLVGAIVGGLSALTGSLLRTANGKRET